jgi:molybdopterin-guanine dinucleotide biosynthesis protein A
MTEAESIGHVPARRVLTGVLLVGGSSSRFGSPKALATFRGESLAARGWRTLQEACDEVLAVGKAADGLELPFPLVDDGVASRAPVFGVLAGLRAAQHDVCVYLPVDCPLVTPAVLRRLGQAVAVPQTGPLPGAYDRAMLAALEARVARGERSLRGVNPTVIEIEERLLADADAPGDLVRLEAL